MTDASGALLAVGLILLVALPVALFFGLRALAQHTRERYDYPIFLNSMNWLVLAAMVSATLGLINLSDFTSPPSMPPQTTDEVIAPTPSLDVAPIEESDVQDAAASEPTKPDAQETAETAVSEPLLAPVAEVSTLAFQSINWLDEPSGRDLGRLFPRRALEAGMSGRVLLSCMIERRGRLSCRVSNEDPVGHGFGDAALRLSRGYRASPQTAEGQPTEGREIELPINFAVESEQ